MYFDLLSWLIQIRYVFVTIKQHLNQRFAYFAASSGPIIYNIYTFTFNFF